MTFEQELLREFHRLNKIMADIRKSLDKLNQNLVDISLDKVKEDPLSVKVFGLEDQEESTTTSYSWEGETDGKHQESA